MNFDFSKQLEAASAGRSRPRRAPVYVGFRCGQRCGFCYYKNRCREPMFELEKIKKQIDFELAYGIRDFEFTGGEPSECACLRATCEYVKEKSPSSRIAVITNGGLWKSDVWDVIDEVLLSYHIGKDADPLKEFFPLGCTFEKASKTVEKAAEHGTFLRTNTVVGTFNCGFLDGTVDDIVGFKPKIANFLPVNIFDEAGGMNCRIDYRTMGPAISKAVRRIETELPESLVFIRYAPFCAFPGLEKNVVGQAQHVFDWFDWNRELDGPAVIDMAEKPAESLERLGMFGSKSFDAVGAARREFYEKNRECMRCRYFAICDGVEKTPGGRLLGSVAPIKGKLVSDPAEFSGGSTLKMYNLFYGK